MSLRHLPSRAAVSVLALGILASLIGCTGSLPAPDAPQRVAMESQGHVFGGQQPVVNATIRLYTVGTSADGSAATQLLSPTTTTRSDGSFTITGLYNCSSATQVYITATGGTPGGSTANPNLTLMTALGACSALTSTTFITINELTTIAAVSSLSPYMTSITAIGASTTHTPALNSAFAAAAELVNTSTGAAPGLNIPSGYTDPVNQINTLGNILATCINSTGGTAGDSSPCGNLFALTTPNAGTAATETVGAILNLAKNPTLNTLPLYNLATAQSPFAPTLTQAPPDFNIRLTEPASAMALQVSAATLTLPSTPTGYTSATQSITLTNSSSSSITLNSIATTGANSADFPFSNGCPSTLQALATCRVQVALAPAASGSRYAYLGITSSTVDSPQYVSLAGTGAAAGTDPTLQLSGSSLSFTQAAESTSAAQTIKVTNTGSASLSVTGIAFSGASATNFAETDTCSAAIAPLGTCTISVTFAPFLAISHAATMTVSSNAGLPQTVSLAGSGTGSVALNTSNSTKWVITTGTITYEFDPATGHVTAVYFNNNSANSLLDTTTQSNSYPDGLYMDDSGTFGTGTNTYGYTFGPNNAWLDVYFQTASSSTNAFTSTQHIVFTANDNGFHAYSSASHSASDIAGSIGQWQYVLRIDLTKFVTTFSNNSGLNNLGITTIPQPSTTDTGSTDAGRAVQNAAEDLHGFTDIPSGFTRSFYTKYDYSSFEYLHKEHGVYGSTYGAWLVFPSTESLVGGPTKQDLIFTNNIIIGEMLSSHLDNNLSYTPPQGVATNRLFGPIYYHFNTFTSANTTPTSLYQEAQTYLPSFNALYDNDTSLTGSGYIPSTSRGTVAPSIAGGGSATANTAWVVLSDNATNFQYSSTGNQYWTSNNATGNATLTGVAPGNYRLSAYVLGQWGELRKDNVAVTANNTTVVSGLTFTPENFGTYAPIWTIGTPDRSAHEFLHGADSSGNDLRNYWGAWNYWSDFASTSGTQIYYATASGSNPATNNLNKLNYTQWGQFDPGLFGGYYSSSDDTTDGYKYIVPSYVTSLTESVPPTQIHFVTTSSQQQQGQYAVVSIGVACSEASITAVLNGHTLVWHGAGANYSDCMIRSGLGGYYQWVAFQWDLSNLSAVGSDNVLTLQPSQPDGYELDAIRMEITNKSADPAVTGWHDYEYLYNSTYTAASDAVPNN